MTIAILSALALIAITVAIHACGLVLIVRALRKLPNWRLVRDWHFTGLLIILASWLIVLHLLGIVIWGFFYLWMGLMSDLEAALYFSGVTYTTIGYGELVLAAPWRALAPVEGLMGVLMGGLSASFFFTIVNQIITEARSKASGRSK